MEIKKSYLPVIRFNIYYIKVIQDLEIQSQGLHGINMYCKQSYNLSYEQILNNKYFFR